MPSAPTGFKLTNNLGTNRVSGGFSGFEKLKPKYTKTYSEDF